MLNIVTQEIEAKRDRNLYARQPLEAFQSLEQQMSCKTLFAETTTGAF